MSERCPHEECNGVDSKSRLQLSLEKKIVVTTLYVSYGQPHWPSYSRMFVPGPDLGDVT